MSIKDRIRDRLVDDWQWVLRKSASVKLAVVASTLLALIAQFADVAYFVLAAAPEPIQAIIGIPVFVVLIAVTIGARLWKQDKE